MKSYGMTHIGQRRSVNQDYIFYTDEPIGNLPNLYIVADGMGGHKAGDRASSFAVEKFIEIVKNDEAQQPFYLMKKVLSMVNHELVLLSRERPEFEGMGTTFVAASVLEDSLYVMNIGDSRLYKMENHLTQVTKDHSLVEELVRSGQLTKEEARVHPQKNLITKALGVEEGIEPDFFQLEMKAGDRILLCSDGLTNMVEDKNLEKILVSLSDSRKAAEKMIEQANEKGGLDNIAVIVAKKEEER
ncbi:MAG: Stp1/IreP family PP2C-type Ser/Thr phosphatase [Lachnospiraceae bacterium]|nr:Stp1/IreP family PP2C-type Ser/Thr phosphatase [Lachnospiraceae bacterium]